MTSGFPLVTGVFVWMLEETQSLGSQCTWLKALGQPDRCHCWMEDTHSFGKINPNPRPEQRNSKPGYGRTGGPATGRRTLP